MKDTVAEDNELITALVENNYPDNVRSGQGSVYATMYTEDAIWMPPDAPDCYGPTEIAAAFDEVMKMYSIDPTLHVEEIQQITDDSALVLGKGNIVFKSKGDHEDWLPTFRPVWFFRKVSGEWKIARQIWNVKPAE